MKYNTNIYATIVAASAVALFSAIASAHPVKISGDQEVEGSGYVSSSGGFAVTTSSGCLRTGQYKKGKNTINACEGIEEPKEEVVEAPVEEPATETPAPQPVAKVEALTLDGFGLFDTNSDVLTAEGQSRINELVAKVGEFTGVLGINVAGHTDSQGSDEYNQDLSERRAATVAGIIGESYPDVPISSAGFGESQPIANNDTAEGRAANRRVDVDVEVSRMTFN